MPSYTITLNTTKALDYAPDATVRHRSLVDAGRLCEGLASGTYQGTALLQYGGGVPTQASGTVTISSGTGTITATINGVAIPVTWATSDTNTATLLKNAINASSNALVAGIVTASSAAGVLTVTSVEYSKTANAITLAASGTGATASGARLTGGAGNDVAAVAVTM